MNITKTIRNLIIANVLILLAARIGNTYQWLDTFGLVPYKFIKHLALWQVFTYMFFHLDVWHLLINMFMLAMFGAGLERCWGTREFLKFYFICGVGAGLISVLTYFNSPYPIIGASGAIFGLLVAWAVLFPNMTVYVFFLFPMKMKYAVILFAAINLFGAVSGSGGIAYFTHLGGALIGYLYLKRHRVKGLRERFDQMHQEARRQKRREESGRVDKILDKISREGMDSLTPYERKVLEQRGQSGK